MQLLHVVPTYLPAVRYGGPIFSVHNLCKALVERGHEVEVFTTSVDGSNDSPVPIASPMVLDGVKVTYFSSPFFRRLFWAPGMKRALERTMEGFELVHLHSVFLWPTFAAARTAERQQVPYLIAPRGILSPTLVRSKNYKVKSLWLRLVERHSIEHAAGVHVTSRREGDSLSWLRALGYRLPAIHVIPNPIDSAILEPKPERTVALPAGLESLRQQSLVLYLGRISWKKNLDLVIEALPSLHDAHFVIAGNDDEGLRARLERKARRLAVEEQLTFTGPVYGAEKAALLRAATVFVLPSRSENFSNSVLEAMAVGCPVIISPEVGLAECVRAGGCGIVLESEVDAWSSAIQQVLADGSLRAKMSRAGKEVALRRFGPAQVAAQMEDLYQHVVDNGSKARTVKAAR